MGLAQAPVELFLPYSIRQLVWNPFICFAMLASIEKKFQVSVVQCGINSQSTSDCEPLITSVFRSGMEGSESIATAVASSYF